MSWEHSVVGQFIVSFAACYLDQTMLNQDDLYALKRVVSTVIPSVESTSCLKPGDLGNAGLIDGTLRPFFPGKCPPWLLRIK